MIADKVRLPVVEKAEGAVVERQAEKRHVIGVHHAVGEADGLPAGDKPRGSRDNVTKPDRVFIAILCQMRPVVANGVIRQQLHLLRLPAIVKVLEVAEAQMAFGNAHQHCALLGALAVNRRIAGDNRQRAGGRDAESVHRLRRRAFAQGRTQHRPAVAHARIGRQPRAFKVPVKTSTVRQLLFAEQDAAAVAELPGPDAELVAAVNLRQRAHTGQQRLAAPDARPFSTAKSPAGRSSACASGALCHTSRALSSGVGDSSV